MLAEIVRISEYMFLLIYLIFKGFILFIFQFVTDEA
jgi:hypothetical protein